MQVHGKLLVALAGVGLIGLYLPSLIILSAMSIIGLPLAAVLWAAPAVATVLIPTRLLQTSLLDRWLPRWAGFFTWAVSAALVLAVFATVAALDRRAQAAKVQTLFADDVAELDLPLPSGIIAVRSSDRADICNDLCRRLLLTRAATTVLLQTVKDSTLPLDPAGAAHGFRLEPREQCPEAPLGDGGTEINIGVEQASGQVQRPASSLVLMRTLIAQGTCLIDGPAQLDAADVVISRLDLSEKPQGDNIAFLPGTALIEADRLTVHQRGAGGLRETYRWTGGTFWRIWPVAVPVPTFGYAFNMGQGFGRTETVFNTGNQFYGGPDWPGFLTDTLGLALVPEDDGREGTRAAIIAVLDRSGAVADSNLQLIDGYLDEVGIEMIIAPINQPSPSQQEDRALWQRIILDDRVPLPYAAVNAVPPIDLLTDAELKMIARAAFDRIWRADPEAPNEGRHAGDILARLPDTALATVGEDLFRLTENRERRWWSLRLLTRLSSFGDAGAERLTFLIGDARIEDREQTYEAWQHPYLAGLTGLCQMGPAAASQRESIDALVDAGIVEVSDTNYGRLTVNMLVALGYARSEVAEANAQSPKPFEAARLESEINRALAEPDCTY